MASSNYSTYERELKAILEGHREALGRYRRTASSKETLKALDDLEEHPFLVVRAAGSHGFDLVALRGSLTLPIEVKCSGESTIHFASSSGRNREQYQTLLANTRRAGLVLLYAYRLVGGDSADPWRIFSGSGANGSTPGPGSPPGPKSTPMSGIAGLVSSRTPTVDNTANGNQVLRWEDGRALMDFLPWILTL